MSFILASMLLASTASTATSAEAMPVDAPPPPEAPLQQRFDWATRAGEQGRCQEAVAQFEAIERTLTAPAAPLVKAAIAVRKGQCLLPLGQIDQGETAIRAGLPTLITQGANFRGDVRMAHLALGAVAMARLDYAIAEHDLRAALALSEGQARVRPLVDLARVTAFDGGPQPLAYAQEAIDLLRAREDATTKEGKEQIALAMTIHARILLNQGQVSPAFAELQQSVSLLGGGLTTRISLSDVTARSDLAIAALLDNKPDLARQYLAYTGAGRMKDAPFASARQMDTPDCGAAEGLMPEDMAVIEFSLGEDGAVKRVTPIYSRKGRDVALAFARAVRDWAWTPEDAKAIPAFYRVATRIELRCSNRGGPREGILSPVSAAFWQWTGVPAELEGGDVRALPAARALAAGKDGRDRLAAIAWMNTNRFTAYEERERDLEQAVQLAERLDAPAPVKTYLAVTLSKASSKSYFNPAPVRALLARPEILADPLSAATARLSIASPAYRYPAPPDADALIDAVIQDDRLPANDPLKISALLQKASFAVRRGDLQTAQASFARTGLTEQQCAIIGPPPALQKTGINSESFPRDAMAWGFDGWVKTEFDIGADGKTQTQRAIIAYPPFVFNKAAVDVVQSTRYEISYRPETKLGCAANQRTINFQIAR